jgi:hypothetical protein
MLGFAQFELEVAPKSAPTSFRLGQPLPQSHIYFAMVWLGGDHLEAAQYQQQ